MQSWQSPPILETISNIPDINWNNKNDLKCDWQRLLWPFQYLIMVRNCFKKRQIIFTKNKQTPEWYHHHPSQKSQNLRFSNVDIWKAVPTKASANWPLLIIFASCTSAKLKPFVQMSVNCQHKGENTIYRRQIMAHSVKRATFFSNAKLTFRSSGTNRILLTLYIYSLEFAFRGNFLGSLCIDGLLFFSIFRKWERQEFCQKGERECSIT